MWRGGGRERRLGSGRGQDIRDRARTNGCDEKESTESTNARWESRGWLHSSRAKRRRGKRSGEIEVSKKSNVAEAFRDSVVRLPI